MKKYYDLVEKIAKKRKEREEYIDGIIKTVSDKSRELGIETHMDGRPKPSCTAYTRR